MKIIIVFFIVIYFFWRKLDKYNPVDYGHKWLNRLLGLNQIICRKYHRLGDYWLTLPKEQGAIIASNHQSGMDPVVLIAASKRPIRFLTTSDYYNLPGVGYILRSAGCIPVYRNKDNAISLQKAVEALNNGELIGIFPFGGIHLANKPEPRIRSGVAVLSRLAKTKIYPVHIGGVSEFSHNKVFTSLFFLRSKVQLTQYQPILSTSEDNTEVLDYLYKLLSNHQKNSPDDLNVLSDSVEEP